MSESLGFPRSLSVVKGCETITAGKARSKIVPSVPKWAEKCVLTIFVQPRTVYFTGRFEIHACGPLNPLRCREGIMFRACLGFVFAFIFMAASGFSQTNSEKATQVPSMIQDPPKTKSLDSTLAADSAKAAAKDKRKSKAKAEKAAMK